jgi:hypothetical protein
VLIANVDSVDDFLESSAKKEQRRNPGSRAQFRQTKKSLKISAKGSAGLFLDRNKTKFPWSDAKTFNPNDILEDRINLEILQSPSFRKLLYPPFMKSYLIIKPLHRFVSNMATYFPKIKEISNRRSFESIASIIFSDSCMNAYNMLTHYCYWTILHPLVRKTLLRIRNARTRKTVLNDQDIMFDETSDFRDEELSLEELAHQLDMHDMALQYGNDEYFHRGTCILMIDYELRSHEMMTLQMEFFVKRHFRWTQAKSMCLSRVIIALHWTRFLMVQKAKLPETIFSVLPL